MSPAAFHVRKRRGCMVTVRRPLPILLPCLTLFLSRYPAANKNRQLGFCRRTTSLHIPARFLCGIAGKANPPSLLEHLLYPWHLLHADRIHHPPRYEA